MAVQSFSSQCESVVRDGEQAARHRVGVHERGFVPTIESLTGLIEEIGGLEQAGAVGRDLTDSCGEAARLSPAARIR